ncbi:Cytochrome C oxidase, mono-heme subunit/FixO [Planctomycetes bacterium Pan216]|uniref:Cytochrome C oxidase, mono-heme subunit/FixO n=1 Tax=Kolteria novifilia TaxID=2527975 RepID=A0A518B7N6_9BACT|nr:Cytochrome C oxidase, mono-heme subunit/FixO [Planctomycetes bacterium Pan216]
MFETKSGVFLIAGLFFFAIAFLGNALVPMMMYRDLPELTAEQLVNPHVMEHFRDLSERYPESFEEHFVLGPTEENCAEALRLGRSVYVGEACWHCHSQFVRPVGNETVRWGPVAETWEYQNELQRPVLFGTRRVGPDLSREAARRSNDWHAAHFYRPVDTSPGSVMPEYPWLFDGAVYRPNKRGLALITYMQFLGTQLPTYPYYERWESDLDGLHPGVGIPKERWEQMQRAYRGAEEASTSASIEEDDNTDSPATEGDEKKEDAS